MHRVAAATPQGKSNGERLELEALGVVGQAREEPAGDPQSGVAVMGT
jgi:hypothetical protein